MKTLSFYFLVIFILCGSALANAGSIDINLYCKIPSHTEKSKAQGGFVSYVTCLDRGKQINGDIDSDKIRIYGIDVYNNSVSSQYIKKGVIDTTDKGLKLLKKIRFSDEITAKQLHADTKLFCEKYIKNMNLCKIGNMMFHVKMDKNDANTSFKYIEAQGPGRYTEDSYKFE